MLPGAAQDRAVWGKAPSFLLGSFGVSLRSVVISRERAPAPHIHIPYLDQKGQERTLCSPVLALTLQLCHAGWPILQASFLRAESKDSIWSYPLPSTGYWCKVKSFPEQFSGHRVVCLPCPMSNLFSPSQVQKDSLCSLLLLFSKVYPFLFVCLLVEQYHACRL